MDSALQIIPGISLEKIIFYLSGLICHQDKTILISVQGHLLPLCPRCLGLHTGFMFTLLFPGLIIQKLLRKEKPGTLLSILFIISITGIHWLAGYLKLIEPDTLSRFLTGLLSGAGLGILLKYIKHKYLQPQHKAGSDYSIIPGLLTLLLLIPLISIYEVLLIVIMVMVIANIISITLYLWLIINKMKIMEGFSEIPGRYNYENK